MSVLTLFSLLLLTFVVVGTPTKGVLSLSSDQDTTTTTNLRTTNDNNNEKIVPTIPITSSSSSSSSSLLDEGTNLDGVADYSYTLPFVNVVKQSRIWGSLPSPWDGNCTVDEQGWPNQSNFGNVFVTIGGNPNDPYTPTVMGNWSIQFTGQAVIVPHPIMGSSVSVQNYSYDKTTDTSTAVLSIPIVTSNDCNCLMLGFANASTVATGPGLQNIEIRQPGYTWNATNNFSTPFLTLLSRFSTLRFMDWAKTNGNMINQWNQRTLPSSYTFAGGDQQVPWEIIFSLANTLQKDAWINIPINASDDYILQLATLAKQTLDPSLHLYLEYSNEVWNFGFSQYGVNFRAANASVYAGDPYHFNASFLPESGNQYVWPLYRYVWFSVKIANIFGTVYGSDNVGKDKTVRPVFCWQENGGEVYENGFVYLTRVAEYLPYEIFHSICLAPYITIGDAGNDPNLTVDEVIAGWTSYANNISINGPYDVGGPNYIAGFSATCSFWGIYCTAYESGPDTVQGLDTGQALYAKANASVDPRLTPIITNYIRNWHSLGGQMKGMNYFTAGAGPLQDKYGIYTILYNMEKMESPKLDGINYAVYNGTVPVSSVIPTVPVRLNASYFTGHPYPPTCDGFDRWPSILNYLLQAPSTMNISITVTTASEYPGNVTLQVGIGGILPNVQNITCFSSGNWYNYTICEPMDQIFTIPEGVSTVRVVRPAAYPPWIGEIIVGVV